MRQRYESYPGHWEYVEGRRWIQSWLIDSLVRNLIKPDYRGCWKRRLNSFRVIFEIYCRMTHLHELIQHSAFCRSVQVAVTDLVGQELKRKSRWRVFYVRQEVKRRRDEEDAVIAARPSHMEKMADRKGSDATRGSGFHNLWILLARHKNYSGLRRNQNIWWSDVSLLWMPSAPRGSRVPVAPRKQSNMYLNLFLCFGETGSQGVMEGLKTNMSSGYHSRHRHAH